MGKHAAVMSNGQRIAEEYARDVLLKTDWEFIGEEHMCDYPEGSIFVYVGPSPWEKSSGRHSSIPAVHLFCDRCGSTWGP